MFEAHVLHFLRKYLGEYVHGLSTEALRISVWKGDVVLKDLKLKAEALNSLKLPVTVKAGFVGTITLKVPWKSLGKEPVIVLVDRVFILARPAPDWQSLKDEDREKIFEAKLQSIEEAELATLEAASRGSKIGSSSAGNSWLGSLIATIIGNLKITISNVHVRYEDCLSNPGHPFCCGITLAKLAAVTTDEHGNETFDTSGALDKLRKSLQLQRLAVYHDPDSDPWKIHKNWEELNPGEWSQIFSEGIDDMGDKAISPWARNRKYLVSPINGTLKYHRLGKQERQNPDVPYEKASLVIPNVSLTILESQYYDGIKLLESLSRYRVRVEVSHLRPVVRVSENPKMWWRYAMMATLQQRKMCYRFSWERIKHLCYLRRRYVRLYTNSLQLCASENGMEMRQIERDLDSKVIILWRLLAHAKIESVKSKEASQRMGSSQKSWWSFGWRNSSGDASISNDPVASPLAEQKLTKEEWQAINKILSYEDDEDITSGLGKDIQTMIQFLVDISIEQAAARIISIDGTEILCGRFEQLNVIAKIYHKSIHCNVLLRFCGLYAPEGSLAQSVSSEKKENALAATFVRMPLGENVDWRLSATISPCHVTVLMESYERFLCFIKRSNAVSPTVALETATALQLKLEQVTRRAQEQIQMVLEEQSRFALDIDFDAPKVRIPFGDGLPNKTCGSFLLDFGHFTLHTKEDELDEQKQSIYSRFYISGRDIAAFFVDSCDKTGSASCIFEEPAAFSCLLESNSFYSLIDRCRMSVIVDQIKAPHPSYPSTRISVQVPILGIHFSPERYQRIYDLLNIFSASTGSTNHDTGLIQSDPLPWHPADLSCNARVLVWKGIGHSSAEWQPCFIVLSGLYLYVLDSESSLYYQRCCSIVGRHVFEVPPTNIGGSPFALAISFRGSDVQKALESSSTLIIEFQDEVEKFAWLKGLTQATYRASAYSSIDVLGKSEGISYGSSSVAPSKFRKPDLVLNGSLIELKLSVYGKLNRDASHATERLVLVLLAGGGKVNLVSGGDLTVKMKLHSFMIRDELQSRSPTYPQYLACSITKHHSTDTDALLNHDTSAQTSSVLEEDDMFKDALPDFMVSSDQGFNTNSDVMLASLEEAETYTGFAAIDGLTFGKDKTTGNSAAAEVFYEAEDSDSSDFVSVIFISRCPDSPLYEGIDTQMSIRMAKLHFFCNRPTVVALIDFGFDLGRVNTSVKCGNDINATVPTSPSNGDRNEDNGRTVIKGLLGYGKQRIVFNLRMDADSVCVFLNKEDESQLAMLVQESFLFDLKVHPSSTSIDGSLGNLRFCDMSLGQDHRWGWLCDILNQSTESLIKFTFQSFSAEDNDYEGYDYSLSGHLSAVRIVFLYRFIQEIMAYFMELATPHTEEVIKFVDKVGGFEWLIKKYEMDGASSLKLCLSLETPSIIVPYNSASERFVQLDLGLLEVRNNLSWHGDETDPSAVHLDVLDAQIHGINMAVGVNGNLGNPMIREGEGLEIIVRRSLRDVFRKVPTVSVQVNVGALHCVMSDKEYNIILECACTNISEEPNLPPSFRATSEVEKDSIRMLADKVNLNSHILLHRTVAVVVVDIQYALLELCNGPDGEFSLAQILLESVWVSYRYTSLSETDLYVSISKFSILDIRSDTKPEMRLMLGSYSDVCKEVNIRNQTTEDMSLSPSNVHPEQGGKEADANFPNITMLIIMDYHWRSSSQSAVIRLQQPRVLVVPNFLLAVAEFFVPSLRALTGREETLESKNDPLTKSDSLIISEPMYKQKVDVVILSPSRQLIVDGPGFDEVIYDGCGGIIRLSDEKGGYHSSPESKPYIIVIGHGKKLCFRNVKIENAMLLSAYAYLGNNSSYLISKDDNVDISLRDDSSGCKNRVNANHHHGFVETSNSRNTDSEMMPMNINSFSFEAQVVSLELTFYDSTKALMDDTMHIEKLLRAKMDLSFMFASKENDMWVKSLVKDLTVESGSGLVVLDPVDISGGYTSVKEKTNISLVSTDICIHLPLSVASLMLSLQNQAFAALQFSSINPVISCTNFQRVWVSPKGDLPGNGLTFWRPQPPANYAVLGDCVTSRPIPPSQVVMAISNTYGRVKRPIGFELIFLLSDTVSTDNGDHRPSPDSECSLWMPIAPPGYLAVGCVAHAGSQPPPTHVVHCIRSDLVTSAAVSECIFSIKPNSRLSSGASVWRVDNAISSFYAHASVDQPPKIRTFNLHQIVMARLDNYSASSIYNHDAFTRNRQGDQVKYESDANFTGWDVLRSLSKPSCYMSTPHFERIWWDRGSDFRRSISIWRPIPRQGFCILGDCLVEGLEPPALGLIFKYDSSGISAKPMQFTKVAHIVRKGNDEAYFWYPIAPPGYASLGCVVTKTEKAPDNDSFCCPRMDFVNQTNIIESPISRSSTTKGSGCWSIWKVENQAHTFFARSDHKRPSIRLAYTIADHLKPKTRENISAELKLGFFSLTVLDASYGMITPLFDTTVTNIKLVTHGRLEAMNAVLVCSLAASTFNRQLKAWEPLVEPFDGIFKVETYDYSDLPSKVGKRVRIAATSIVNFNLSSGNLETLVESVIAWRKLDDLQQKSNQTGESSNGWSMSDSAVSALDDDDDGKKVILDNILGCDLYIKKAEQGIETMERVVHGCHSCISVPPPRFSDRLNVVAEARETRYYAAIHVFQAKGLPIIDDGNGHEFFCALRLVLGSNTSDKHKLFPQSARTKCVTPIISETNGMKMAGVKWNELFLFELPEKGSATLELEVTNLASKAGKGEIIGAVSIPIKNNRTALKRIGSVRMLLESANNHHVSSLRLKRRGQPISNELDYGSLQVSTSVFERNAIPSQARELNSSTKSCEDTGFWIGLSPEGPWESFGSLLPLSVIPRSLSGRQFAFEVSIRDGKKRAICRPLAMVINETNVKLEISLCSASLTESAPSDRELLESDARNLFATTDPCSSTVLPWSSLVTDTDTCLQIRPNAESPDYQYNWSEAFTINSYGKAAGIETSADQSPLYRQNTMRNNGNLQFSATPFRLNQLEKIDMFLHCNSAYGVKRNFWLSVGTDASVLHTEVNTPVYDWKITVNAPLRVENKLPYPAEYLIWEKTVEGNNLERQHGIISSESTVFVYSADLRRPIYMSLFVQGCWILEKDSVLLLDLASQNHASSFWMVHEQSNRRLRVSIERDVGATAAAPKIVRFFVPYWITNESSVPLSYYIVEVDPSEQENVDSPLISKAVRSAKSALKHTSSSVGVDPRVSSFRRSSQPLEVIEDSDLSYSMFSPQDYGNRTGVMQFQSRNESYPSQRVGIAVAVRNSEQYSIGVSLYELENKERVDVKAFTSDGSYYRLSAMLKMASDRTKVIHFQPRTLFINRVGESISLKQSGSDLEQRIEPTDLPKLLQGQSNAVTELLEVRLDGYNWSAPFSIENEGIMCFCLKNQDGSELRYLWVEVRSGVKISRNEVIFRLASISSPYRIENRCMTKSVRIRQVGSSDDSWLYLPPNSSTSFCWEDLGRQRLLEVLVDGTDPSKSENYSIDEIRQYLPTQTDNERMKEICLTVHKEGKMLISKISEWIPDLENLQDVDSSLVLPSNHSDSQNPVPDCEFHFTCELTELGISIIDHMPEEILYVSIQNFLFSYSTGLGSGLSRFKLRMHGFQVDNQMSFTPMPVLFRPQRTNDDTDYVAKFSLSMQSSGTVDLCIYPYLGIQGPANSAFLVNIHEPIIWRLHEMFRQAKLSRIYRSQSTAVSVDPTIRIGFLNLSEFRFRVSMSMSPTQRPGGVLGFWSSLMTALGNMENMTVRINQRSREGIYMRQSALVSSAISSIQKEILSQPLRLLSGVDILGNASSALGHMSKGVAALSMDKKFIQSRQKQVRCYELYDTPHIPKRGHPNKSLQCKQEKGVEDIGDVIREGGGALAKGLFRGVTGILTKPLEGAKSSGVEGFVQGVGKGIIGAAAQPVSGVLDLLSKTTEGANAVRMKIASAIMSEEQLLRRRLPRVIGGDNLLKPYDEFKAVGQAILQLAECGSFFGQGDLFKVRGKFALSDAYEDHFLLPKGKIILVTHRRVLLLQQPTHVVSQRRFNPARDPCSVLWDVSWDDLVTMELAHGKKEPVQSPPSRLIFYLQLKATESKECALVVKCTKDSQQALDIYTAIDRAMNSYGPNRAKDNLRMQTKPYSPYSNANHIQVFPKENYLFTSVQDVPASVSTFGSGIPP